ncbi:MAG: ABC transporter permease subunit [Clostridia bacterium]|nr:ABC transporter permease subunit [Clostridia bacterium]
MIKKAIRTVICAAVWIIIWEIASLLAGSALILPSPFETAARLFELLGDGVYWKTVFLSLFRILRGMIYGTAGGVLLAVLSSISSNLASFLSPAVSVVRATPVASFIILAMLWLGNTAMPPVISALMVLPVVYTEILSGILDVKKELIEVADVFEIRGLSRLFGVYIPSLRPYIRSALKNAAGLSWKAGVAAEVLSFTPLSIGREIQTAKNYLETTDMFAWTLTVVILSLAIEKLVFAEKKRKKVGEK